MEEHGLVEGKGVLAGISRVNLGGWNRSAKFRALQALKARVRGNLPVTVTYMSVTFSNLRARPTAAFF